MASSLKLLCTRLCPDLQSCKHIVVLHPGLSDLGAHDQISTELKRSPNYPGVAMKDLQPLVHATPSWIWSLTGVPRNADCRC